MALLRPVLALWQSGNHPRMYPKGRKQEGVPWCTFLCCTSQIHLLTKTLCWAASSIQTTRILMFTEMGFGHKVQSLFVFVLLLLPQFSDQFWKQFLALCPVTGVMIAYISLAYTLHHSSQPCKQTLWQPDNTRRELLYLLSSIQYHTWDKLSQISPLLPGFVFLER